MNKSCFILNGYSVRICPDRASLLPVSYKSSIVNILLAPITGAMYNPFMRVISRKCLRDFWEKHPDARQPLQAWHDDVKHAEWQSPTDIKNIYRNASFLANNRVVFNIKGNSYRLIVVVQYTHGILYIRFVGTHKDYDKIDATTI